MTRFLLCCGAAATLAACTTTLPPDDRSALAPGADAPCPILSSTGWRAWVDRSAGPDRQPTLFLTGRVTLPTPGFGLEFEPTLVQRESHPVQVGARIRATRPEGIVAQVVTASDIRWQWPLQSASVGSVTVECGGRVLATVAPVAEMQ
jgi:hypothetical protein